MTKTDSLIRSLVYNGEALTDKQIYHRHRVANPRAHMDYLRRKGFNIRKFDYVNAHGKVHSKYYNGGHIA